MANYKELSQQVRRDVLTLIHKAKTSHIASNFSVIDIATILYDTVDLSKDRIVWSKGWASATIYYFLHKKGIITDEQLSTFPNEPFYGLAETTVPGVEVNGGAMGHGLPVACGLAYAKKLAGEPGIVYCIMSDGEMFEGTTWESALFAGHHKLDNLVVIIDYNKWCAMGKTNEVNNLEPFEDKWDAFNWDCVRIDGHDHKQIAEVLPLTGDMPYCIIADTIKGKGVSFLTDHLLYHYKDVSIEAYDAAIRELNGEVLPEELMQKLRNSV